MKARLVVLSAFLAVDAFCQGYTDPAPPEVRPVDPTAAAPEPVSFDRLRFNRAPAPLSPDARTSDWPRFLGPDNDATSPETHLVDRFPPGGPPVVWEIDKGSGYTSPAAVAGRIVMFDRFADEEVIECFEAETGRRYWRFGYPVSYTDRYGFNDGPRASAVIDAGKVYTLGVTSVLSCLELSTGQLLWQRDLDAEFDVASYFFGHGSCPLVYGGKVIVNLGGEDDLCVAAFDQHTGSLVWGTRHPWHASYASPVVKPLQGKPTLLVFAGGESRPSTGGLLAIDPGTGRLLDAFPWRSEKYESVNSATPILAGENRVLISECYEKGAVCLELTADFRWKKRWQARGFNLHWMTPVAHAGHVYGFPGRNEPDAYLASFDLQTGEENWKEDLIWTTQLPGGRDYRLSYFRGSLLHADDTFFALGEMGTLSILNLDPSGVEEVSRAQLFLARATWSLPVLHRGLLYVSQHEPEAFGGKGPRLICYDLRDRDRDE